MAARSSLVLPGEEAPDFTATTHEGAIVHLADLRGKQRVVLVFYPGDDTPVCTQQLCELRDDWRALRSADTIVFGVNPASEAKHAQFATKYQLPFPLLADVGSRIAAAYGCSAIFGLLVRRTVYVIDKRGRVIFAQRGKPSVAAIQAALNTAPTEEKK
jgi:thioredoxin-dependent peroxiredoxin